MGGWGPLGGPEPDGPVQLPSVPEATRPNGQAVALLPGTQKDHFATLPKIPPGAPLASLYCHTVRKKHSRCFKFDNENLGESL